MATADCGCILTLYLILCRRCAPRSTRWVPLADEDVTLTKRTSAGTTQQVVLCGTHTCPVTLTTACGDARGRVARKRAFEGFVYGFNGFVHLRHVLIAKGPFCILHCGIIDEPYLIRTSRIRALDPTISRPSDRATQCCIDHTCIHGTRLRLVQL